MRFDYPELVRREHACEERLLARRAVFTDLVEGPDAGGLAFFAVREGSRERVLLAGSLPPRNGAFRARSSQAVFVAEKAA